MISFSTTKNDAAIIRKIAERAVRMAVQESIDYTYQDAEMDITATHANRYPLRLKELLAATDFNFAHDVFGIRRHLDRETGQLGGCFTPRLRSLK